MVHHRGDPSGVASGHLGRDHPAHRLGPVVGSSGTVVLDAGCGRFSVPAKFWWRCRPGTPNRSTGSGHRSRRALLQELIGVPNRSVRHRSIDRAGQQASSGHPLESAELGDVDGTWPVTGRVTIERNRGTCRAAPGDQRAAQPWVEISATSASGGAARSQTACAVELVPPVQEPSRKALIR